MTSPRGRKALGALAASAAIGGLVATAGYLGRSGTRPTKAPEKDGEAQGNPKLAATEADLPDPRFGPDEAHPGTRILPPRQSAAKRAPQPAPQLSSPVSPSRIPGALAVAPVREQLPAPLFGAAFAALNDPAPPVEPEAAAPVPTAVLPVDPTVAPASADGPAAPPPASPSPADRAAPPTAIEGSVTSAPSSGTADLAAAAPTASPEPESLPPTPAAASQIAAAPSESALNPQPMAPAIASPAEPPPDEAGTQPETAQRGARRSIERPRAEAIASDPEIAAALPVPALVSPAPVSPPVAVKGRLALAEPVRAQNPPAPAAKLSAAMPLPPPVAKPAPAKPSARDLPVPAFGKAAPAPAPAPTVGPAKDFAFAAAAHGSSITATGDSTAPQAGLLGLGNGLTSVATIGAASFGPAAVVSSDDELILELRTAKGELNETITAYGTREGVFLPLGEIARLLDLAIVVSDEGRYASGWMLDEKSTLAINLRAGTIAVPGSERPLDPRDGVAIDGELYLKADRFAELMPLALKVDLRAQTVTITTLRPFPFEQRLARESDRDRLAGRSARAENSSYLREPTPWLAASFPVIDVELRGLSDSTRGTRAETDLRLAADIGFMTGQGYVSLSSSEGLIASRLELGRRDPDARLLGPLHATEFQIGDVATLSMPLGLRGIGGRGGMITNAPLERASVFERIDLRGELADGYEVELYRNNTLVGSSATPVNGQYAFLQVPVEFGLNVFRLVFYGPQGQRREEVRRISVGDGRLAKGQLVYSFGVAQKEVNLFDVRPPTFIPGQDFGAWRAVAQVEYGVSANLTTVAGGAWYESLGSRHWIANAGLRTGLGPVAAQFDLGLNDKGGKAFEAQLGGTFAGISLTAAHAEYIGLFSDELRAFTIEPLRRASEANLIATARFGPADHRISVPIAARARRIEFADGRVQADASLRASLLVSRLLLSNSLDLSMTSAPGLPGFTQLTGTFDLTTLSGSKTRVRAGAGYAILPAARLSSVSAEVDRTLGPDTLVKAAVERIFDTRETRFGLSAVQRLGPVSLSFDGSLSVPRRDYSAVLRLGFSFGRNPLTGSLFVAQPGMSSTGAVAARAFIDANANGRYDAGEVLPPDVEFDTGSVQERTGPEGVALLGRLGNGNRTYLRMNADSLPDIDMASAKTGVAVVPRPGRIHATDFPVITLGELEGNAWFGESRRGVSGLTLWLVDASGKRIKRVRTSSGGGFLFEQVRPGSYTLALDPDQAARLGLTLAETPMLHLPRAEGAGSIELKIDTR